jgi:hypothetical protein
VCFASKTSTLIGAAPHTRVTELRIEFLSSEIVVEAADFRKVLAASPCLSSLTLCQICLNEFATAPVTFPHLHISNLQELLPLAVAHIFSWLTPGLYEVHLRVPDIALFPHAPNAPTNLPGLPPLLPLLQRANVSTLCLSSRCEPAYVRTLLQSLPNLRSLYLAGTDWYLTTAALGAITR